MKNTVNVQEVNPSYTNRRSFLKISGLGAVGAGLLLAGCSDDDDPMAPVDAMLPGIRNGKFDLGGGDFGVLTYAYALEQLEADFYTKVVNLNNFGSLFNTQEKQILEDIYKHEVIHREFFKAALSKALPDKSTQLLPDLAFKYDSVNFTSKASILGTAKALEDTGVAAYNGAGKIITSADYLLLAGKIVSVEARHASAIRSLLDPNASTIESFAGSSAGGENGLDLAKDPSAIITVAAGFISTQFTATYLP